MNSIENFNNILGIDNSEFRFRRETPAEITLEKLLSGVPVSAFDFLNLLAPEKKEMLNKILKKIKFTKELLVHPLLPLNVAGAFSPQTKDIYISPLTLLNYSEAEIAHVLFHEGLHAGMYTDGIEVDDEALVETLTKKRMAEIYGKWTFESGYDSMVTELSQYFGNISFAELMDMIEKGDEKTFDNFVEIIVLQPLLKKGDPKALNYKSIENELRTKWKFIAKLFPRIVNSIGNKNAGVHDAAKVQPWEYKMEGLLQKAADNIVLRYDNVLNDILIDLAANKFNITEEYIKEKLWEKGFGYLLDFHSKVTEIYIKNFVPIYNLSKLVDIKVDMQKLAI